MEILYLLIPIGLILLALSIKLLFWAVRSGQYDDLDTEGRRILFDEDNIKKTANSSPSDADGEKTNPS